MKRAMLFAAIAAISTLGAFGTVSAADCGDGGSPTNASGSCDTAGDQVRCGAGTATPLAVVSAGATGAEVCNEGQTLPLQGRAGAQQDCRCAYIDGDDDNNHDLLLNGWLRLDEDGVWCRERAKPGSQSYNSSQGQPLTECFT